MREIKFRAWDTFNGRMFYSSDKKYLSTFFVNVEAYEEGLNAIKLMQFTGIKDKNEKEIYEGDIVQCDDFMWVIGIGWTKDDEYGFYQDGPNGKILIRKVDFIDERYEVIGNIYENPELLKA